MKFWKDKVFLKSMISIVIPIALQNLITSSLNMIDTLMISNVGQSSIAAVGLANQVFFFFALINFGINSGASIFISQYWGKKDITNIRRVLGFSISLGTITGIIFTIAAFFFPENIMRILIPEAEVIKLGSQYLRIIALSYIVTAIGFSYGIALRSTGRAKLPMKVSAISFIVNTVFNYLLIFGKFGFPALGVRGAAIATLLARVVELSLLLYAVYHDIGPLTAKFKELIDWNKSFIKSYIDTVSPVILNEGFWALGQVLYSIAYARIGEEAAAAIQLTITVQNIFFVLIRGVGNACAIMVGNNIGRGQMKKAYEYAVNFIIISVILGLTLGITMALTPDLILKLFNNINDSLYATVRTLLVIMGLSFFIRATASTIIVGILRGGGDTKFSMFLEMGSVWLIGVPAAFIGALVFKWPVQYVVILVMIEEVVKFVIGIPRVLSKKWIRQIT